MSDDQKLAEVLENLEKVARQSIQQPIQKRMLQHFLTGMASSLGALIAIAIVVPLGIYILKQIDWIPLLGDFFDRVVQHMEAI